MIITCPHCRTRYEVATRAIGERGRSVQCANCGQSWLAERGEEPPEIASAEPAEPVAHENAFDVEFEEVEPSARSPDEAERTRARLLERRHRDVAKALPAARLRRWLGSGAIFTAVALMVGIVGARATIVQQVPDLASFYGALGMGVNVVGLDFTDVRTVRGSQHGTEVLMVEGRIRNVTGSMVAVPPVHVSLEADDGEGIYEWRAMAGEPVLEPGESVRFETQLMSPPSGVAKVMLRFDPAPVPGRPGIL